MNGGAVFRDDKLVGWLTRKETRGLNWVLKPNEVVGGILIKAPNEETKITIETVQAKSQVEAQLEDNRFKIKLKIDVEGDIAEDLSRNYNITRAANIAQLNKRFAQVIKNEIINALKKIQKYKADIFGFGEKINEEYPQEFKKRVDNWDEIYAKLPVKIEVTANIRRPGLIEEGIGTYK
ncbi:Ger(x)C family spore germination C-terminal domain-containing protein [Acetohalobium arabaticum]|uniref:Ger(x)C family spore germination C-terminal domain-containing protein n=1 Tax=Acetohalobium arabaticum TaxID=28187 RepID=UPI001FE188FB|nr:Ger(x)C family spore germination C-terminal domain-containing protein [Acetohalobium arabaticum]